jgi:periplasmic divalent cation tolerance protein
MTGIVSVYATFSDLDEAKRIGRALVEERLAACINILGSCTSFYRWQGKIEQAEEVAALFKTGADTAPRLIERLAELHSYEVPAAVVWPVERTLPAYQAWVLDESQGAPAARVK